MTRRFVVAGAQLGPIARDEACSSVVTRLVALMEEAARRDARVVVFHELALGSFFLRWWMDHVELDPWFDTEMVSPDARPLFDAAARLRIGFHLGNAERTPEGLRFNTAILRHPTGRTSTGTAKIHLPGNADHILPPQLGNLRHQHRTGIRAHGAWGFSVGQRKGSIGWRAALSAGDVRCQR